MILARAGAATVADLHDRTAALHGSADKSAAEVVEEPPGKQSEVSVLVLAPIVHCLSRPMLD